MSKDDEPEQPVNPLDIEINDVIIQALRAKRHYQKQASAGSVNSETERIVRDATIDLYNMLRWWRDENAIEERWEDAGLPTLEQLLRQQRRRQTDSPSRLSSPGEETRQLAIADLSAADLIAFLDKMLDIARDLGFAPTVDHPTTRTEITDEMIEEVEKWRKANL